MRLLRELGTESQCSLQNAVQAAAVEGQEEILEILLSKQTDINAKGITALSLVLPQFLQHTHPYHDMLRESSPSRRSELDEAEMFSHRRRDMGWPSHVDPCKSSAIDLGLVYTYGDVSKALLGHTVGNTGTYTK